MVEEFIFTKPASGGLLVFLSFDLADFASCTANERLVKDEIPLL